MPPARATIELLGDCDNRCVFCVRTGLPEHTLRGEALTLALTAARRASDELTFVGGEPTLREDLPEVVSAARSLGFRRVGIQTHARRLGDRTVAHALARAGLTDVHGSVHGLGPVHDYHTGVPGSFGETAAGLAMASSIGLTTVVTTVLTRSNCRALAGLPGALSARGTSAWRIAVPHAAGRARRDFDRVIPRLAMALPFALHALRVAQSVRLVAWITGAPWCLLGPYAGHAMDPGDFPRAYGTVCEGCTVRAVCPGVDPAYLARFAGDELTARTAGMTPAYVGDRAGMLARMFVGAGRLSLEKDVEVSRGRVSLPMTPEG